MTSTEAAERVQRRTRRDDAMLALLIGLGVDVAFNQERHGAAIALFAVGAATILRSRVRRGWEDDLLLAGAVVLASFSAILAAEWLIVVDLMVATALVVGAVAHTGRPLFETSVLDLLRRAGHVIASALHAPAALLAPVGRTLGRIGPVRLRKAIRAVAIASPVLLLFTLLLASADRVFGDLVVPDLPAYNLGAFPAHAWWIAIGSILGMTALLAAQRPVREAPDAREVEPRLAPLEWGAILAGVDALFALFVAVQLTFLFGGAGRVRVTEGLTYAEYARSGFFQLLAVAVLTVLLILALWDLGDLRRHGVRFKVGVSVLVALTGVILVSAAMRMVLYERAFGLTLARLVVMVAIIAVAAALAGILAVIWLEQRTRVVALLCCCFIGAMLVLNVVNPERFVAERNVERLERTGKIDVGYLMRLGPDSVTASVRVVPRLEEPERRALLQHLCAMSDHPGGWRAANLGRARAERAVARMCTTSSQPAP